MRMQSNTLRALCGYYRSVWQRYSPLHKRKPTLDGICNYLKIDDTLTTSGQPTEAELQLIGDAGFNTVINLAPHTAANALPDERAVVERMGLDYVHIPVDFKNPTDADFEKFCEAMQARNNAAVLVHCAANMRVSA